MAQKTEVVRNLGLCNIRIRFDSGSCIVRAGGERENVPADALKTEFAKDLIESGTLVVEASKSVVSKGKKPEQSEIKPEAVDKVAG